MKKNLKKATLKDVAKLAGVSPITVSRFVNTPDSVSETAANKILKAIEQSGYVPNAAARQLKTSVSNIVYFIVPNIKNELYSSISHELMLYLSNMGKSLFICDYNFQDQIEEMLILEIIKHRPAAIIMASGDGINNTLISLLKTSKIPVIQLDRVNQNIESVTNIEIDNFHGGELAGQYLCKQNVKKVSVLSGNTKRVLESRIGGFLAALEQKDIEIEIIETEFNTKNCHVAYELDLSGNTGYFLLNSDIANQFLSKNSKVLTQELAEKIVSFDCITNCEFIPFELATITYNMSEFCINTNSKLDKIFNNVQIDKSQITIPVVMSKPIST